MVCAAWCQDSVEAIKLQPSIQEFCSLALAILAQTADSHGRTVATAEEQLEHSTKAARR